jgi:monoterpene epsilon-lactone hydrolase
VRITVVRRWHDRTRVAWATIGVVEDENGSLLPLPKAPDAIELRHLRAFIAVAEELNFGRAAGRLYVSQPALSRQIRALERLVGCDLLRRSTHRVELTIAGEALLDRAGGLLRDLDDAISATRSIGGELAGRMAKFYQPLIDLHSADHDLQELRTAVEELHAQLPVLPEVAVRPANAGGVPALRLTPESGRATMLYLHGGGYVSGSAFGFRPLVSALVSAVETGAVVPEYRLAPEHPFPAALDDALRTSLWMLDGGTAPGEVIMAGDSAGGGLVLSLLISLKQQELPMPGCALVLSPWVDIEGALAEREPSAEEAVVVPPAQLRRMIEYYLAGHPNDDPLLNPTTTDLAGLPPMLIQVGTGDPFRVDAEGLADNARRCGVDVRLELYPVSTHTFHVFWSFLPEAADALKQAGRFARAVSPAARSAAGP